MPMGRDEKTVREGESPLFRPSVGEKEKTQLITDVEAKSIVK